MSNLQTLSSLLTLQLLLPLLLAAERTVATAVKFSAAQRCPQSGAAAEHQVLGLQSQRACIVECAANHDCAAVHHNATAAVCSTASVQQLAMHWVGSDRGDVGCVSHVQPNRIIAAGGIARNLSFASRLLAFYQFQFGLANQMTHSSVGNASISSQAALTSAGVKLSGNMDSFIQVDMGNLTKYLQYNNAFTYFAKYERTVRAGKFSYIHSFTSSSNIEGGLWAELARINTSTTSISIESRFFSHRIRPRGDANSYLPVNANGPIFTAVTFNGTDFDTFYYNGTMRPASTATFSHTFNSDWNARLRLGYYPYGNDHCMQGTFICWGVAMDKLSAAELLQLEHLC